MINHLSKQKNWQTQISEAITDINELLSILKLQHLAEEFYQPANFGIKIPRGFVDKMKVGDANDPLFLQVVPDKRALQQVTGYTADPLGEAEHNPSKGILHKYKSRVLLTMTGACAVHCRYCFRQHFDYGANTPSNRELDEVTHYLEQNPEVNEVLFSGGDPLSLSNRRIKLWLDKLATVKQIKTVRFHTRLPVVVPERIDDELIAYLQKMIERFNLVMVLHINHANEIDDHTARFIYKLKQAGVTLLNQAVLLAGVNDDVATQVALNQRVFAVGILPYYLFVLDKVAGAAYFDMDEKKAIQIYWQMMAELPGYLMPKLAREVVGEPYKMPIDVFKYGLKP